MTNVSSEAAARLFIDCDIPKAFSPSNQTSPGASKGLVFEIRRFCLHDGPGIRSTVFFKGCPLSCQWCHNPEGRSFAPTLMYFRERCRHCGECVLVCPNHAIQNIEGRILTGPECQVCGTCVDTCTSDARQIAGRWMTVPEIVKQVERDMVFFDESQGGVTFSGGEPLYQPFILGALLDAFRQRRIHTTVETCGFVKSELLEWLREKVDLFLYDVKILDPAKHLEYVGVSNDLILANLERLARGGSRVIVRVPLITGINDSQEEIGSLGRLLGELGIEEIHLLPYHTTGAGKYTRLGLPYFLEDLFPPEPESIRRLGKILEELGLRVVVGGHS